MGDIVGDIGSPNSHFPHVLGEQSKRGDDFFFFLFFWRGEAPARTKLEETGFLQRFFIFIFLT